MQVIGKTALSSMLAVGSIACIIASVMLLAFAFLYAARGGQLLAAMVAMVLAIAIWLCLIFSWRCYQRNRMGYSIMLLAVPLQIYWLPAFLE